MNFVLAIQPNIKDFEKLYKLIFNVCLKYYNNEITSDQLNQVFATNPLHLLFSSNIFDEVKNCYITYIESMLILYLENKHPKYVQRLSCGTFNSVYRISVKINGIRSEYALRLSKNEICKINFKRIEKQNWYDNLLYYNDISLMTYLKFYPNIHDSSKYPHHIDTSNYKDLNIDCKSKKHIDYEAPKFEAPKFEAPKSALPPINISRETLETSPTSDDKSTLKIYYTHWSISKIYAPLYNINKYRNKYIQIVKQLLAIFEKNELLYFDWKLNNFMIDENDELVLVDTDFENIYSLTAVCSTHRLTPDPSTSLNKMESSLKMSKSILLMYISAYLSIISISKAKNINEYYMSFKFINKLDKMINNESTINSVISLVSDGKYSTLPNNKRDIKSILKMIKDKLNLI